MFAEVRRRWIGVRMDGFAKAFLLTSLLWLSIGTTLGLTMAGHDAAHGGEWGSRLVFLLLPSHAHLLLLGWLSQLVFGVGYHLIPRIGGSLIRWPRMAWWHFALAQAGLAGMATGYVFKRLDDTHPGWFWMLAIAGTLSWVSVHLFVINIVATLWRAGAGTPAPALVRPIAGSRPGP